QLFKVSERRIDHTRAGRVKAIRTRFQHLDEFVAVAWRLGDEREQHQLQVVAGELAAPRQTVIVAEAVFSPAAPELAAAMAMTMAADCVPEAMEERRSIGETASIVGAVPVSAQFIKCV